MPGEKPSLLSAARSSPFHLPAGLRLASLGLGFLYDQKDVSDHMLLRNAARVAKDLLGSCSSICNLSYHLHSLVLADTWDFDHLPYFPLLQEMLSTSINQSIVKIKEGPSSIWKILPHGVQLDSQQHPNLPWVSKLSTVSRLAPTSPKAAVQPGSGRRTGLDSQGSDSASHKSVRCWANRCVWASSQKPKNIPEGIFKKGSATCYVENCVISGDGEDSHFVTQRRI